MKDSAINSVSYWLDADDQIIGVSERWLSFALQNGAPQLRPETVVGRQLWSFISGQTVRHLFQQLLGQVRERGRGVSVPFRCDSPERRRYMRLSCLPLDARSIEMCSTLLREEPREPAPQISNRGLLRMCSWCKRIARSDVDWMEIEAAAVDLGFFERTEPAEITHVVCPDCSRMLLEEIGADRPV